MKSFISTVRNRQFFSFFLLLLTILLASELRGQSYIMGTHRTIRNCSGIIYDDGGANGNYGAGRNDTMTIISNSVGNSAVRLTFAPGPDIQDEDTLFFYNASTAHPDSLMFSIGSLYTSWVNNSNTLYFSDIYNENVTAYIPNLSGAITLRFKTASRSYSMPVNIHETPSNFTYKTLTINEEELPYHYGDSVFYEAGNKMVWFSKRRAESVMLNVISANRNAENTHCKAVTGTSEVAKNSIQTYQVQGDTNNEYQWTIEPASAGRIVSGQGTSVVAVEWNGAGQGILTAVANRASAAGFKLTISCTTSCQPLSIDLVDNLTQPNAHYDTTKSCIDGYKYVDVCPDQPVTFVSNGVYTYNDWDYHQSDTTSIFHWSIGDEAVVGAGLSTLTRTFGTGRGYTVTLYIEDVRGCRSGNAEIYRIRTSRDPIKELHFHPVCVDSTTVINVGYQSSNLVVITPVQDQQASTLGVAETIFLPDGEDCGQGLTYESPVTFSAFQADQKITKASDIISVCLNMEHSYPGDLRISLTCPPHQGHPNGREVMLHSRSGGSNRIGEPCGGLGSTAPYTAPCTGDGTPYCSTDVNKPGTGWNYCFSQVGKTPSQIGFEVYGEDTIWFSYTYNGQLGAPNQTMTHYNPWNQETKTTTVPTTITDSAIVLHTIDTLICIDEESGIIDTTFKDLNFYINRLSNVYTPVGNFSDFIGCPLNGTWKIKVKDELGIDNGYIFSWELALNPKLLPKQWDYEVKVDSVRWNTFDEEFPIVFQTDTSIAIRPLSSQYGYFPIAFTVVDEYGCEYERTTNVVVNPLPDVTINGLHNGTFPTCSGESAVLVAEGGLHYLWSNRISEATAIVNVSGEYVVTATDVNGCENSDTATVVIYAAPPAALDGQTEACIPELYITPQAPIFCNSLIETGFDIYDGEGNLLQANYQNLTYTDPTITNEGDYHFVVVSRYDDVHVPVVGDILCTDNTYVSPDQYAASGKVASGVLFWINDGSLPGVTDDYWVVHLKDISRARRWGDNILYDMPTFTPFNATTDYAGEANTDTIRAATTPQPQYAAESCRQIDGTLPAGSVWSLPAAGQMQKLIDVLNTVNNSLAIIGSSASTINTTTPYWTSTQADLNNAYTFLGTQPIITAIDKSEQYKARPIASAPLVLNRSDSSYYTICYRKPIAEISSTGNPINIGGDITLTVSDIKVYDTLAPTQYAIQWLDPTGAPISTANSYSLQNMQMPGDYTYTATITPLDGASKGCSSTATFTILVRDLPAISGDPIVCLGDIETYTTAPGHDAYQWSLQNNLGTILSGEDTESITIQWDVNSGNDQLSLICVSDGVPTDEATLAITITPMPSDQTNLTGSGTFCSGDAGREIVIVNPQVGVYYHLYLGATQVTTTALTSVDGTALSFGFHTAVGTYTVRAYSDNNFDANTCEVQLQDEVIIQILPTPPARPIQIVD